MSDSELARLDVVQDPPLVVAALEGDVDASNADELTAQIASLLPNSAAGLVLDLSRTRYLDSAGIRMLLELARRVGGRGQEFSLVVPENRPVRRLLELAEVGQVISLRGSHAEAARPAERVSHPPPS